MDVTMTVSPPERSVCEASAPSGATRLYVPMGMVTVRVPPNPSVSAYSNPLRPTGSRVGTTYTVWSVSTAETSSTAAATPACSVA
jgi:hypothetical protein